MTMLRDAPTRSRYRMLGDLANRISAYPGFAATTDDAGGSWLRVAYGRQSILVSVEDCGKAGWFYRWGNHKNRCGPVGEITSVAHEIATLLMSRHRS